MHQSASLCSLVHYSVPMYLLSPVSILGLVTCTGWVWPRQPPLHMRASGLIRLHGSESQPVRVHLCLCLWMSSSF
ncbi:hypothetical protein BDV34DRAFT_195188 [Aspergillus parasiticus]|uniref:Uncharacterized protein n=1 Tax=Aspergillus parasiticus TaxID=5067 RepID=A0A5N6DKX6_ASPPA|nr:hypothetical protein BDV34DRAFT_195188 [Aspergillus parasiticus]